MMEVCAKNPIIRMGSGRPMYMVVMYIHGVPVRVGLDTGSTHSWYRAESLQNWEDLTQKKFTNFQVVQSNVLNFSSKEGESGDSVTSACAVPLTYQGTTHRIMCYATVGYDKEIDLLLGLDFMENFGVTIQQGKENPKGDYITWYSWMPKKVFDTKKESGKTFSQTALTVRRVSGYLNPEEDVTIPPNSAVVMSVIPSTMPPIKMKLLNETNNQGYVKPLITMLCPNTENPSQHGSKVNGILGRPNLVFPIKHDLCLRKR